MKLKRYLKPLATRIIPSERLRVDLLVRLRGALNPRRDQDNIRRWIDSQFGWEQVRGARPAPLLPWGMSGLASSSCRQEHFDSAYAQYWLQALKESCAYHRKQWEFFYICQVLHERDQLRPGRKGLGFGVGKEPLTAIFANRGCSIVATDMDVRAAERQGWARSGQHASGLATLNVRDLCPPDQFARRVQIRDVDMNRIPADLTGFDFCWSACALEHLGSLDAGLRFIHRSLDCLAPGGIAVHTTEYNLSSNDATVDNEGTVLFRRQDFERLQRDVQSAGHRMEPLDLDAGRLVMDSVVDVPPYEGHNHLRKLLGAYVTTSAGVIIQKSGGE